MSSPISPSGPDRTSALPLLLMLARRARLLVAVPLACVVLTALICKTLITPVFTAHARILPPQYNEATVSSMQNQLGGESQIGNSALTLKNPTDLFVGILNSRTILDAVIAKHNLPEHYGDSDQDSVRTKLASATTIRAEKDGIISIGVDDRDANRAAALANAYVEEFYALAGRLARSEASRRSRFYRRALDEARVHLYEADLALAAVERRTGLTRLNGQDSAIVQATAEIEAAISAREVQLRTMSSYATARNPDMQLINAELANLRRELARARSRSPVLSRVPAKPEVASQASKSSEEVPLIEIGGVPDAYLEHVRKKRDVLYWESIVSLLGRYSELGKIDERRDMSLFQVLDEAVVPTLKSKPRTLVSMILAGVGSLVFTLLYILASAYIRERKEGNADFAAGWKELQRLLAPTYVLAPVMDLVARLRRARQS